MPSPINQKACHLKHFSISDVCEKLDLRLATLLPLYSPSRKRIFFLIFAGKSIFFMIFKNISSSIALENIFLNEKQFLRAIDIIKHP